MSCDISRGRLEPCKDSVGGLNAVYFINKGGITAGYDVTDTDVIDDLGSPTAYKFDIKGGSTYTENITSSRENGTTTFEQVLELQLTKLTKEDHKTVKLLAYGSPHVLIEDNNGNVFVAGLEHGLDVSGGTIVSGAAMGDMSDLDGSQNVRIILRFTAGVQYGIVEDIVTYGIVNSAN